MVSIESVRRLTYFATQVYFIGSVAGILWLSHFRFLWRRRRVIVLATLLVALYALPIDAWAVAQGWGGFNPDYVSGIYFFGGSLLLEEVGFWVGTPFVTVSAVLIFAELERRHVPWWMLPAGVALPFAFFDGLQSHRPEPATVTQHDLRPTGSELRSPPHPFHRA